jgi:hypothetical protein
MPDSPEIRVSDQERERAVHEIRDHFAAGRLSEEELDERVQAAYQARTNQELQNIRADLPQLPASPAQVKAELAERRGYLQRRLLQEAGGGVIVFVVCSVIWLAAGASGQFWPIWVALVALIPLLRNGWRLYGPAPDLESVERELERRRQKDRYRTQLVGSELSRREQRDERRERGRAEGRERRHRSP